MSGGILPRPKPRLVDENYVPTVPGVSSIYTAALPVGEYWHGVFGRNDPDELVRITEVCAAAAAGTATETQSAPAVEPPAAEPETESTAALTVPETPPDGGAA